ncbi:inositol hexakisphosphate kinase 1 isoform X4 [Nematostella vectensis]|uniref:inositol hexakisphosphate kinase 1 isoform X4 n=2 Tax=Nematostella vectensis TaxID=45351 RepID=UPI0020770E7A|nr:inositol hexakisphosphate kinase 1 isoform X4 [Nematostella vectensis]
MSQRLPRITKMAGQSEVVKDFTPLEPFVHQVGGHSSMMKFDEISVCKPYQDREDCFYKELPSDMKTFTPEYRGVVYVSFKEDTDGYIHIIAHPDKSALEQESQGSNYNSSESDSEDPDLMESSPKRRSRRVSRVESVEKRPHRVRLRSGRIELVGTRKDGLFEADDMPEQSEHKHQANPWGLHLHSQQLSKMAKACKLQKFIVLENVAYQFSYPCILDLKMGTRQHGDDAPSEKRARIMAKVESSTSKTLGVRACGLQVYQQNSGRFMCRNKYYGLKLTEEGFKRELVSFLNNGQRLRLELIEPLVQRLRRLYKVLDKQHSYRFYSSSLLLMYEGDEAIGHYERENSTHEKSEEENSLSRSNSTASFKNLRHTKVDVRMIDFAHTTWGNTRSGPDKGYLFGIENLIRLLEEIMSSYMENGETD